METFELDPGERGPEPTARGPRGPVNPLVWVAIALACGLAAVIVLAHGLPGSRTNQASPTPIASPPSAPQQLPAAGPGQRQYLSVAQICDVHTDHLKEMSITFKVLNVSPYDVAVTSVKPVLPDGGLRPQRITSGGNCTRPGTRPIAGGLAAGASRYFTVNFGLPNTCPAAYQVLARIHFTALGFHETSLNMLAIDLAAPDFDRCPKDPAIETGRHPKPPKVST